MTSEEEETTLDNERISAAVSRALDQGAEPFAPVAQINPNSFLSESLSSSLVSVNESVLNTVIEELRQDLDLALFDGGWIQIDGTGGRLELRDLAHWLLAQALKSDSETAVGWLQEFIQGSYRSTLEVLALAGIAPQKEVTLPLEVSLIPFLVLPRSQMSE